MKRIHIRLAEEQYEFLKQMAKDEQVSVAELVRRSVDVYIDRHGGVSSEERKRRLLSIVGLVSSGDSDLAENHDRYLGGVSSDVEG